jgi:uncharacterized protein YxeA
MLKNAIIIILSLLLIIIIYAYLCLSNGMQNYEKERLAYVITKEEEIKKKEESLIDVISCNNELDKVKNAISQINELSKTCI